MKRLTYLAQLEDLGIALEDLGTAFCMTLLEADELPIGLAFQDPPKDLGTDPPDWETSVQFRSSPGWDMKLRQKGLPGKPFWHHSKRCRHTSGLRSAARLRPNGILV